MKNSLKLLFEMARPFYADNNDPSHDFAHIERVVESCRRLGELEGANLELLIPAALLHDVVNIPKNHPQRAKASELAANKANLLLLKAGYLKDQIDKIHTIILEHSFSLGMRPSTLESAILQDADKLDALGAIGIMRTLTCGAKFKASYYDIDDPFALNRKLDDKAFTLDHFYTKLFKLPELMNTETARSEAQLRVEFMQRFVGELRREILSNKKTD